MVEPDTDLQRLRALNTELVLTSRRLASTATELSILGRALIQDSQERGHRARSTMQAVRLWLWVSQHRREARRARMAA